MPPRAAPLKDENKKLGLLPFVTFRRYFHRR